MKKRILLGALFAQLAILTLLCACTATQRRVTYNSLYSVEQTTTAAVDSYDTLVIKGTVPTNDVPRVSAMYNDFQASLAVALDAVQFNTNALAPPALVQESTDIINLINTLRGQ